MLRLSIRKHFQVWEEMIVLMVCHRRLIWEVAKREITDRYTGQVFGIFWTIAHPFILISIYVFVFNFVFKTRIGGTSEMPLDYVTYLLAGLIPWVAIQEVMSKATTIIKSSTILVKQTVFPIEVLPISVVLTSLLNQLILSFFLLLYVLISYKHWFWTYSLLPVLFFIQSLFVLGVSFVLSSIAVYLKDMKDIVQILSVVGIYLMPIVYLPTWVPNIFRPLIYINPFSHLIWCYQDVIYFGRFEHSWAWVVTVIVALTFCYLGFRLFRKLKIMFGDVL